jgi:hypothetical protein
MNIHRIIIQITAPAPGLDVVVIHVAGPRAEELGQVLLTKQT